MLAEGESTDVKAEIWRAVWPNLEGERGSLRANKRDYDERLVRQYLALLENGILLYKSARLGQGVHFYRSRPAGS